MLSSEIDSLLATRLGFDSRTVGPAAVGTAVRLAMKEAGVADPRAYARQLIVDHGAWEKLVDRVVVPETLFFRDGAPFELVAELAYARWQRQPERTFRVLSCPCSTGEEPYSVVMALFDAGLPPDSFAVTALDVSRRAVDAACAGFFRANSFRGSNVSYRARYFDRCGKSAWRLRDLARSRVDVRQGNILAPLFLADEAPFDVVFCRNLMIYMHDEAKTSTMAAVRRLLAPDGALVVGHAEAAFARQHGFTPLRRAGAFAFRQPDSRPAPRAASAPLRAGRSGSPRTRGSAPEGTAARASGARAASAAPASEELEPALARARRLADAGHLQEAMRVCREHLARTPDSADGYFLMGVLHDAEGKWGLAVPSFRKALYLNPSHLGALHHLALRYETSGDRTAAALLRARARRAGEHSGGQ